MLYLENSSQLRCHNQSSETVIESVRRQKYERTSETEADERLQQRNDGLAEHRGKRWRGQKTKPKSCGRE